jgi:hypothetical protein
MRLQGATPHRSERAQFGHSAPTSVPDGKAHARPRMQDTRLGEELVGQFRHLRPDIDDDHALMRTYPRALFFQSTLQRIRTQRPRASISFAPASPISVTGFLYLPTSRRLPLLPSMPLPS